MNNSLRSSLKENLSEELALPLIDIPDRAIDSLLALIESKLPDGDKMPAILMGSRDYAYQSYATSAYKYAIDEVKSILRGSHDN